MRKELLLLALMLCSCGTGSPAPTATPRDSATPRPPGPDSPIPTATPPPGVEAEEYAIYSALIRQNPIGYNLGDFIVVRGQTVGSLDMFETTLENVHPLPASLVDSYRAQNAASHALSSNLDIEQDYVMMSQEDFDKIFGLKGQAWGRFQERYPEASGFVLFSRVGFNDERDQALVDFGYRCGDLCGAGGLYLLVKEDGQWKVQEELMVWQS
ncbi:MAG: hypothetical protein PVF47_19790 [Anaerolineae bacterium]|jgi:hypothetical protein